MRAVGLGIDPAARADFFARAAVQAERADARALVTGKVLDVDRIRGISYEAMAPLVLLGAQQLDLTLPLDCPLGVAIDGTGAGSAPAERLWLSLRGRKGYERTPFRRPMVGFKSIILTGGGSIDRHGHHPYEIHASRALLIGDMVLSINERKLDLSGLDAESAKLLVAEMKTFRRGTTPSGRERLEHSDGQHDDILFALALGWWIAKAMLSKAGGYAPARLPDMRAKVG